MDLGIKGRTAIVCAASKGLGRACALSLARNGVDLVINGLLPGQFQTDRLRSTLAEAMQKFNRPPVDILAGRVADIPAARFGDPAEFGEACALQCAASSGYLAGQIDRIAN